MAPELGSVDVAVATISGPRGVVPTQTIPGAHGAKRDQLIVGSASIASVVCFCMWPCSGSFVGPTSLPTRSPSTSQAPVPKGLRGSGALSSRAKAVAAAAADAADAHDVHQDVQTTSGLSAHAQAAFGAVVAAGAAVAIRRRRRRQMARRASTAPIPVSTAPVPPTSSTTSVPASSDGDMTISSRTLDTATLYDAMFQRTTSMGRMLAGLPASFPMALLSQYTLLPLLTAVATVVCPSKTNFVRGLAGAMGLVLGTFATNFLDRCKKDAARAAVLRVLADTLHSSASLEEVRSYVEAARQRFGVGVGRKTGEAFEDSALQDMYASLLMALLDVPEHSSADLPTLQRLRASLGLDSIVVGMAHKRAAQVLLSKGYSGMEGDELKVAVDKFLFLSERAFADDEIEEARLFEMGRLRKVLKMKSAEAKERISAISRALYQQALSGVVNHVDAHTAEVLSQASSSFGVDVDDTAKMNTATYRRIASNLLEGGSLNADAYATLARAREVLQLGERSATGAFNSVAGPSLKKDVDAVVADLKNLPSAASTEQIATAASRLARRREELGLQVGAADAVVVEGLLEGIRSIYSQACQDARLSVGADEKALARLDKLLAFASSADAVLAELRAMLPADTEDAPAQTGPLSIPADTTSAGRLYGLYLERSLAGNEPEGAPAIGELARVFQLTEEDQETARIEVCQPRLKRLYTESIEKAAAGKMPIGMAKMAVGAELNKYSLPASAVEETAMDVYKSRLGIFSDRVLKQEEKDELDTERGFLELSEADVRRLHLKAFGRTYESSVDEAMGVEGIMHQDARGALEKLRARLGIDKADAQMILHGVVDRRLKDSMQIVKEAWEDATLTKEQLQKVYKERGQDVGDAPFADGTGGGLGITEEVQLENVKGYKFMVEATKVAESYVQNGVFKEGSKPGGEDAYPVTVGKYLDEQKKEEFYGNYAWNAVTCQDAATKEQWQRARPHIGGILGLSSQTQDKVMQRMVSRWCNMFIKQKLEEQGALTDQDLSTLNDWVPSFFNIDKSVTKDIVKGVNRGILQGKVLKLMNQTRITPEDVQKVRAEVATWDLRLEQDFELTKPQLRTLFRVEVMSVLEDPQKSDGEKRVAIAASKEAFGLGDAEAHEEMTDLLKTKCKGCLVNAVGDMMQGNTKHAVKEMERLELLSAFAQVADGVELAQDWEVALAMRQKLVQIYAEHAETEKSGRQPNIKLLNSLLGLDD